MSGLNRQLGLSDELFVLGDSVILTVLGQVIRAASGGSSHNWTVSVVVVLVVVRRLGVFEQRLGASEAFGHAAGAVTLLLTIIGVGWVQLLHALVCQTQCTLDAVQG